MNCESCNGVMTRVRGQNHHYCHSCSRFQFPTKIENAEDSIKPGGKVTDFQCPKCETALEVGLLRDSLDVCFCETCRGFVIDSDSFGPLINGLRASYTGVDDKPMLMNPDDLDIKINCPACLDSMEAHPYYGPGNAVIDTCMHCRLVWFDHGELARLVRASGLRAQSST